MSRDQRDFLARICPASHQEGHPSPGKPFQGGTFDAYLPDSATTWRLLPRLEKAFKQGLTFTVVEKEAAAKVTWSCIPHKTSLQGGKSGWVNVFAEPQGWTTLLRVINVFLSLSGTVTQTPPTSLAWQRS